VILMIALWLIDSLVVERSQRARTARAEIASSWGQSQIVGGPVLIIPYRTRDAVRPEAFVRFLPERVVIKGRLLPERRHRGIFETVLYRADLAVEGNFARPDFSGWNIAPEDILWNEARINVGITDLRGIRGNPVLKWDGQPAEFSGAG